MDKLKSLVEEADPLSSWWPFIIAIAVGLIMTVRTIMGGQGCPNSNQIDKQIVIVTGAGGGIGLELCKLLASRSAHVVMALRDMEKAERTIEILRREIKCKVSTNIEFEIEARYIDLRSFDSVRRFAGNIIKDFRFVDVLINNAGIIFYPTEKTADGFEIHLQVNYLAPFLLTHLLISHLSQSENGGRVINVSGHAYASAKMDVDDPLNIGTWSTVFHPRESFAHSKLAVVLATRQLAKCLKGKNITVNCCSPGLVRGTDHLRRSPIMSALCIKAMTYPWMWLFMKNPFEGAQCALYLATDPKLKNVTGEFFNDCEKIAIADIADNELLQVKLYHETLRVLKIENLIE